jgi:hypothetical protein
MRRIKGRLWRGDALDTNQPGLQRFAKATAGLVT